MKVNFFATLRPIVGSKTVEVGFTEGLTLRQVLNDLSVRFPQLRPELLDENGNLCGHVHVFVNGRDATFLPNQVDALLKPEDVISIFPPVGGG